MPAALDDTRMSTLRSFLHDELCAPGRPVPFNIRAIVADIAAAVEVLEDRGWLIEDVDHTGVQLVWYPSGRAASATAALTVTTRCTVEYFLFGNAPAVRLPVLELGDIRVGAGGGTLTWIEDHA